MNENSTIKELETQARNTKYLVDRLTIAAYGVTVEEIIKKLMDMEDKKND